jgi:hypothetical protein
VKSKLLKGHGVSIWTAAMGLSAVLLPALASAQPAARKPNILVLFGDDIGSGTSAPTTAG